MATYKISLKNHFKHLWALLYLLCFLLIVTPFIYYIKKGYIDFIECYKISAIVYFIFVLLQTILFVNYYLINKKITLSVDYINNSIVWFDEIKKTSIVYRIDNISLIEQHKTYPFAENRYYLTPWDEYHYLIIYFKNGEKIIITSLLSFNFNIPINDIKHITYKHIYPYIKSK